MSILNYQQLLDFFSRFEFKNAIFLMNSNVKGNRYPENMIEAFQTPIEVLKLSAGKIDGIVLNQASMKKDNVMLLVSQQLEQVQLFQNLFTRVRGQNGFKIKENKKTTIKEIQKLQQSQARRSTINLKHRPFSLKLAHYILYKEFLNDISSNKKHLSLDKYENKSIFHVQQFPSVISPLNIDQYSDEFDQSSYTLLKEHPCLNYFCIAIKDNISVLSFNGKDRVAVF